MVINTFISCYAFFIRNQMATPKYTKSSISQMENGRRNENEHQKAGKHQTIIHTKKNWEWIFEFDQTTRIKNRSNRPISMRSANFRQNIRFVSSSFFILFLYYYIHTECIIECLLAACISAMRTIWRIRRRKCEKERKETSIKSVKEQFFLGYIVNS